MHKALSSLSSKKVGTCVLLTISLTGCSTYTAENFSSSSLKMAHHTTILGHQTHRAVNASNKNSSNVNFEYEEIVTQ